MKKLFELGAICIWWNIWQSHGSHGPCLHYPIFVSSAPRSPAEPPHGGAFCPRGFSDRGQYVPKVRSRGKAARTPLLQWLFNQTLHSGSERGERYKVALITHLFNAGKGEQRERGREGDREGGESARKGRSVNTADKGEDPEERRWKEEKKRRWGGKEGTQKDGEKKEERGGETRGRTMSEWKEVWSKQREMRIKKILRQRKKEEKLWDFTCYRYYSYKLQWWKVQFLSYCILKYNLSALVLLSISVLCYFILSLYNSWPLHLFDSYN